jgi:Ca-activated chloride channel family protein
LPIAAAVFGCAGRPDVEVARSEGAVVQAGDGEIKIKFAFGSEKEEWIREVTPAFNNDPNQRVGGKRIRVEPVSIGSGELIEDVISGRLKAHLVSPASLAFIKLGNAEWRKKSDKDLIGPTRNLVRSPVVIAMWKPMAEALGWPDKPIGWAEVFKLAASDKSWQRLGYPEWDPFRFGHTHPELSNSGLISIFAEVYAAPNVRKTHGLTVQDVEAPETGAFMEAIEKSVMYYGSSTGFFGKKMFKSGPRYLSAAVMYENMVIESYDPQKFKKTVFPVVAVYPKEGTFMSDHPVGIVEREWVTDEHRAAAEKYVEYLFKPEQQKVAMRAGFRPGLEGLELAAPLDKAHGVDPSQPQQQLQVPSPEVMDAARRLWQKHRKRMSIILVFDTSGSMADSDRLTNAKISAREFVEKLGERDYFSFIPFSTQVAPDSGQLRLSTDRTKALGLIDRQIANGETALYDAIDTAYQIAQGDDHQVLMPTIIVLTDGLNNRSKGKKLPNDAANVKALQELLERIKPGPEKRPVPIFTIGYALDPRREDEKLAIDALRQIAQTSEAAYFAASPDTIEAVLRSIRKYF